MHIRILSRPPEPERADDHERPADHRAQQALLRRREPAPLADEPRVVRGEHDVDERAERGADADGDEDEAHVRDAEVSPGDEDDGDGGED